MKAGKHTRYQTPVYVNLPKALPAGNLYTLKNTKTGKQAIGQLIDSVTMVFILPDSLGPGSWSNYTVTKLARNKAPKNAVTITQTKAGLQVSVKNKPIFFYHTQEALPAGDSAYYRRSGFIHPLYSPGGQILTDDFPDGHTHQHAIFNAWTRTTFRKEFVDFWNQQSKKGTVEHIEVSKIKEGPVVSELRVKLRHRSLLHGEVLREMWVIRVYPFSDYYLFDLVSEERNVTTDTLFLEKYHYGGLGFRGSKHWNDHDKKNYQGQWNVLTSEGIRDSAANHTHARWVDAAGLINGQAAGATVFDHPVNFRYPQPIRVHPTMPYWVYSPVVDGAFTINPGTWYRSQYRYYVHQQMPDTVAIDRLEKDWVVPPDVKVTGL
ncbi:PmoA family protein [Paraflavitalea speifideaquila]|uniref:DUF6807 domain-containing protein n=1 Tax=Paraflavitalea speifideaquila TaxID=3076558 RepID=UPI0028EC47A9|nr:PmoA family protein [Paraflavitalea speifideiaquila]